MKINVKVEITMVVIISFRSNRQHVGRDVEIIRKDMKYGLD